MKKWKNYKLMARRQRKKQGESSWWLLCWYETVNEAVESLKWRKNHISYKVIHDLDGSTVHLQEGTPRKSKTIHAECWSGEEWVMVDGTDQLTEGFNGLMTKVYELARMENRAYRIVNGDDIVVNVTEKWLTGKEGDAYDVTAEIVGED